MYVFVKKKFIDVENTNDPINAFALNCGWPDDINGKVFKQSADILGVELIELHESFPKAFFARYDWRLTTDFIASVLVRHKIAVKMTDEHEWREFSAILDDAGLIWASGNKCTEHTPTFLKSRLKNEDKKDPVTVHPSIYYGDRKLAVDLVSCISGKFKVMSYSEFIDHCYEAYKANHFAPARGCGKSIRILSALVDELSEDKIEPVGFRGGKRPPIFSKDSENTSLEMKSLEDGVSFKPTPLNDAFDKIKKSIHQSLVDSAMNQPYDIHISSDGKTTTARFYVNGKVVREAGAICHPEDRFNFHTGAEVAFNRLWEKQPKEKKSNVDLNNLKPGDKVRVRRDLKAGSWPESILMVMPSMEKLAGKVVTIESTMGHMGVPIYAIEDFEEPWHWTPEMFELI